MVSAVFLRSVNTHKRITFSPSVQDRTQESTHGVREIMAQTGNLADRIGVMDAGWIVQTGTPVDIYENPNSRMTAEFIGSVNMFEGEIVEEAPDHVVIRSENLTAPVYIGHGITAALEDRKVWVAVRPEKTLMSREKPEGGFNWSEGIVHDIAYLGAHSVYYIKLPSGMMVQSNMANIERTANHPTWGDRVYVCWDDRSGVVLIS